jgi:hypothetical protein
MPPNLTIRERGILQSCEDIIKEGLETFYLVGRALMMIRDQKLYRIEYSNFESYCRERWDMTPRHAYRFITATSIVDRITPTAVMPTNESQIRPLLKLPEEKWQQTWEEAIALAGDKRVTARHVEAIVRGTPLKPKPRDFGEPIDFRGLRHAPINEQGVVFLFGMISRELGFVVESVHNPFPDCIAKRLTDTRKRLWREVKIEFEFRSRNFLAHKHDYQCDLIVCWEHNWPDCPLEVIALSEEIGKLSSITQ